MLKLFFKTTLISLLIFSCSDDFHHKSSKEIKTTKASDMYRYPRTRVFLKKAPLYTYRSPSLGLVKHQNIYKNKGYQRPENLQITEFDKVSFYTIKSQHKALSNAGYKTNVWSDIKFNEYDGIFIEYEIKSPYSYTTSVYFGDNTFTVLINGSCNSKEEKEAINKMIRSVYFDKYFKINPLDLESYEIDLSITNFTYNKIEYIKNHDLIIYSDPLEITADKKITNSIAIGNIDQMENEESLKYFNKLLNDKEKDGIQFENKEIKNVEINDYSAIELESPISTENESGFYYQAILIGPYANLLFYGLCDEKHPEYIQQYKQTLRELKTSKPNIY